MLDKKADKYDHGKPDMTDIPLEAMNQMAGAFTYGQKKYSKNNFRQGLQTSKHLAAAVRHIYQHISGQTIDPESGCTHIGCAMANLAMVCYTLNNHPHLDDRYKPDIEKNEGVKNGN